MLLIRTREPAIGEGTWGILGAVALPRELPHGRIEPTTAKDACDLLGADLPIIV